MAGKRLVITVAPMKDICPQGKTYPMNSVAIVINGINTPTGFIKGKVLHTVSIGMRYVKQRENYNFQYLQEMYEVWWKSNIYICI